MDKPLVEITYKLADGSQIRIEVSASVKEALEQTTRQVQSQRRADRRHIDFTPLTAEFLEDTRFATCEDTADLYEKIERDAMLRKFIDTLTEAQRNRLYLYYFRGLTYREIAALEGVNQAAIGQSLKQALKRLHRFLATQ